MSAPETLQMFERDTTITPSKLRTIGYIPATIYGKGFTPLSIQIRAHEFHLALGRKNYAFTLDGMGKKLSVKVQQLQKQNTKDVVTHVEFLVQAAA